MTQGIQVAGLYVHDQDEALQFYVEKLGFNVHTDARNGDYRWLTVQHPDQPEFQLGLFRPQPPTVDDATARSLLEAVAKGAMPPLVLVVDDCQAAYGIMRKRGVRVHAGAGRPLWLGGRKFPRSVGQWMEAGPGPLRHPCASSPHGCFFREAGMISRNWIRQGHRWLGMILTLTILANFVAMLFGTPPSAIVYAPLPPLALLLFSGLFLFVQPYRRKTDRP